MIFAKLIKNLKLLVLKILIRKNHKIHKKEYFRLSKLLLI